MYVCMCVVWMYIDALCDKWYLSIMSCLFCSVTVIASNPEGGAGAPGIGSGVTLPISKSSCLAIELAR